MQKSLIRGSDRKVHVAMATDDNYAHHLSVVVCSILRNLSNEGTICLHVLYDQLSEETKRRIQRLSSMRYFELDFIKVDCNKYESLESTWSKHTSRLTYGRLDLGMMLPQIKKCLYLDCDVIVRRDISELYDIDISEYFFGAVEEPEELRFFRNKDLGIPANYGYFNAGVILFNLDMMREHDFSNRILFFLKENNKKLLFGDQDALNALYYDKWLALPLKWNIIAGMCMLGTSTKYLNYTKKEIRDTLRDPAIAHFTQKEKPDSLLCMHPFSKEYWQYLERTPWAGKVLLKDRTFKNHVRKLLWILRDYSRRIPFFVELREIKRQLTGYYAYQQ